MFARDRGSSLSLYVDSGIHNDRSKRASIDTVSLIPLHVTPPAAEDGQDRGGADYMDSVGSGVSGTSRYSRSTSGGSVSRLSPSTSQSSLGLSGIPVPEESRGNGEKARPRSTSSASVRYYEAVNGGGNAMPVPKIVTTPSP